MASISGAWGPVVFPRKAPAGPNRRCHYGGLSPKVGGGVLGKPRRGLEAYASRLQVEAPAVFPQRLQGLRGVPTSHHDNAVMSFSVSLDLMATELKGLNATRER